ncbi:hypothetical protein N7468_002197 [Penicillium chermesinum]|uniref:BTB domain-containing protein n=1 Tax=Penicillium chermesinum TaxID=63820 RepID=A0A9W9PIA7_9EURO|nr:uncharacterized protein N7468_002197 [Penicillium chermesinum]KAJ5247214.1 hypothetical protein N7468_002197 [Penicillium chermesinum]
MKEAALSTFHMPDETIVLVKKMIDYVYTGDYSDLLDSPTDNPVDPKEPLPPISVLQLHAQIFILGDKYCIAELCDTAVEKYLTRIEEQFDPLEFLDSLPDVFFTELEKNMELRTAAIRISRQRLVSCFQDAAVRGKYESIAAQVPGFGLWPRKSHVGFTCEVSRLWSGKEGFRTPLFSFTLTQIYTRKLSSD